MQSIADRRQAGDKSQFEVAVNPSRFAESQAPLAAVIL
jgi:hypothetical protein